MFSLRSLCRDTSLRYVPRSETIFCIFQKDHGIVSEISSHFGNRFKTVYVCFVNIYSRIKLAFCCNSIFIDLNVYHDWLEFTFIHESWMSSVFCRLVYVLKRLYSGSNSNLLMMILVCTVLTIRLILICDRILGLTNNFGYVIMLSAANDILTVIVLLFVFH